MMMFPSVLREAFMDGRELYIYKFVFFKYLMPEPEFLQGPLQ